MIECESNNCNTRVYDGSRGVTANGKDRRNKHCGRCVRLAKEARICLTEGCSTVRSKYAKSSTRCAACVRLERGKAVKPAPPKNRRVKGVFIRDCSNGSTDYIKVGIVARTGHIHLFKEWI